MIQVRRSTVLADAQRLDSTSGTIVRTGRRPCANCSRVGAVDEWPRASGPLSSPAFLTGAAITVVVMAVVMMVVAS